MILFQQNLDIICAFKEVMSDSLPNKKDMTMHLRSFTNGKAKHSPGRLFFSTYYNANVLIDQSYSNCSVTYDTQEKFYVQYFKHQQKYSNRVDLTPIVQLIRY